MEFRVGCGSVLMEGPAWNLVLANTIFIQKNSQCKNYFLPDPLDSLPNQQTVASCVRMCSWQEASYLPDGQDIGSNLYQNLS